LLHKEIAQPYLLSFIVAMNSLVGHTLGISCNGHFPVSEKWFEERHSCNLRAVEVECSTRNVEIIHQITPPHIIELF